MRASVHLHYRSLLAHQRMVLERAGSVLVALLMVGLLLVVATPSPVLADPGDVEWVKQLQTADSEAGVVAADDTGVYFGGWTTGALPGQTNAGGHDAVLAKYDHAGVWQWTRQVGSTGDDLVRTVAADSGDIYVAGSTTGVFPGAEGSQGGDDAFLALYDSAGNPVWVRQFGTAGDEKARAVSVYDGAVYVSGLTDGTFSGQSSAGGYDFFVAKYSTAGTPLWVVQHGTTAYDIGLGVAVDGGGIYVAGRTDGAFPGFTSSGFQDAFVAGLGHDGALNWVDQFGSGIATSIAVDPTGVYVAGRYGDAFAAQYRHDGSRLWLELLDSASATAAYAVTLGPAGAYVIGETGGAFPGEVNAGGDDVFVGLFARGGGLQWVRQLGTSGDDYGLGAAAHGAGVHVAGSVVDGAFPGYTYAGGSDVFVARLEGAPGPEPSFGVRLSEQEVHGYQWPAGVTVDLTIERDSVVVHTDSRVSEWNPGGTIVFFPVWEVPDFDVQPGDWVTVSGQVSPTETVTRDHEVIWWEYTNIDTAADAVSGVAPLDAWLLVNVWDEPGASRQVPADTEVGLGVGSWVADFSTPPVPPDEGHGLADLTSLTRGEVLVSDDDGDYTQEELPGGPQVGVNKITQVLSGWNWEPGSSVDVSVDWPAFVATGVPVDEEGYFELDLWEDPFWLDDPQQVLVVGTNQFGHSAQAAHQITSVVAWNGAVEFDPANLVNGSAAPDTEVCVWVEGYEGVVCPVSDHATGYWTADLNEIGASLDEGSTGGAFQAQGDGYTFVDWWVESVRIGVDPNTDTAWGHDWWPPAAGWVDFSVTGKPECSDSQPAGPMRDRFWRNVEFDLSGCDLVPGDAVTVTHGAGVFTKEHTIADLGVTDVDVRADTVSGWVNRSTGSVWVWAADLGVVRFPEFSTGDWVADFTQPPEDAHDVGYGSHGQAGWSDDDHDATVIDWAAVAPIDVVAVSDVDSDGHGELAVLYFEWDAGRFRVVVKDATDGGVVSEIDLPTTAEVIDVEATTAGEVVVLYRTSTNGMYRVRRYDAASGASVGSVVTLGSVFDFTDLEVTPGGELAVLGASTVDGRVRVRVDELGVGFTNYTLFGTVYSGDDLEVTPAGGLAVLGVRPDGVVRTRVVDPSDASWVQFIFGSAYSGDDLEVTATGEVVVMGTRFSDGLVRVRTGAGVNYRFGTAFTGTDLEVLSTGEMAVMGERPGDGQVRTAVQNGALTAFLYGPAYTGVDLVETANGELAVLGQHRGTGQLRVRHIHTTTRDVTNLYYP